MAVHYFCSRCDIRWLGDPWCEGCGKVTRADPEVYGLEGRPGSRKTPMVWTKESPKEVARMREARKFRRFK